MTKGSNIMKLELKHLAPYLPYKLKYAFRCKIDADNDYIKELKVGQMFEDESMYDLLNDREYFPILRPLSDLIKEVEHDEEKFVPIEYLSKMRSVNINSKDKRKIGEYKRRLIFDIESQRLPFDMIQKLFEWHFDVFGLIDKGLAIDINTL